MGEPLASYDYADYGIGSTICFRVALVIFDQENN